MEIEIKNLVDLHKLEGWTLRTVQVQPGQPS